MNVSSETTITYYDIMRIILDETEKQLEKVSKIVNAYYGQRANGKTTNIKMKLTPVYMCSISYDLLGVYY